MKGIEQYIEFAIKNGYGWINKYHFNGADIEEIHMNDDWRPWNISTTYIITSKEYLESVARGITDRMILGWEKTYTSEFLDLLTHTQAIAIRDNKLPEYINNLLPWKQ